MKNKNEKRYVESDYYTGQPYEKKHYTTNEYYNEENEGDYIDIGEILNLLKKNVKLIVAVTLLFTIVSAGISFFALTPKYKVTAKLFIGTTATQKIKGESGEEVDLTKASEPTELLMYQKLIKTYAEVMTSRDLIDKSLAELNIDVNPNSVKSNLAVTPGQDTQILNVAYTTENPKQGQMIVKTLTYGLINESENLISNGNIRVIEKPVVPTNPISPNKKLNIIIAFLLGIMVSIGIILLKDFLDNTYKSKSKLENDLGLPVLGVIPTLKNIDQTDED